MGEKRRPIMLTLSEINMIEISVKQDTMIFPPIRASILEQLKKGVEE